MMGDDAEKPESGAREPKPPKIKAEDNPWYLLATLYGVPEAGDDLYGVPEAGDDLYGVPEAGDDKLKAKNRIAWNRYFAGNLGGETRTKLNEEKRHPVEELTPFAPDELQEVATAFAERCKASAKNLTLPTVGADIDFSDIEFEQRAFFDKYLFRNSSFNRATFSGGAFFEGASFSGEAFFYGATFSGLANFDGAAFSGQAYFHGATFSRGATFDGATFSHKALFTRATFSEWASFDGATFSGQALFFHATFSGWTDFGDATFSGGATFDGATFSRGATFYGVTFSPWASFEGATFGEITSFVNAEMKGMTSFEGAIFKLAPLEFFGAKLHEGTVWPSNDKWPKPKDKAAAKRFVRAYERLKLEMDRLKKHDDELNFFALELQSRRVSLGTWTGLPIAIYGVFSDYGRSYLRPLVALFYLALIGTLAFLPADSLSPGQSLGLSAANTLNAFGFRKDFFEPTVVARLPAWLDVVSALQTILGTVLLFLFGLGIRNKFRMK